MSLILVIVLFASQMSYYEAKDTTFGCTSIEEVSRLRSLRSDQMAFQIALLEKQILLRDEYGYVLAISLNHIRLDDLKMQLGLDVELADEYEIEELFDDCVRGAIPPAPANAMGSIRWSTTASRISPRFTWRAAIMRRWFT